MNIMDMILTEQTDIAIAKKRIDDMLKDFAKSLEGALAITFKEDYEALCTGDLNFCIRSKKAKSEPIERAFFSPKEIQNLEFQIHAPKKDHDKIQELILELLRLERSQTLVANS